MKFMRLFIFDMIPNSDDRKMTDKQKKTPMHERISEMIARSGKNHTELSNDTGINRLKIGRLKSGETRSIDPEELRKLILACGYDADLLHCSDDEFKSKINKRRKELSEFMFLPKFLSKSISNVNSWRGGKDNYLGDYNAYFSSFLDRERVNAVTARISDDVESFLKIDFDAFRPQTNSIQELRYSGTGKLISSFNAIVCIGEYGVSLNEPFFIIMSADNAEPVHQMHGILMTTNNYRSQLAISTRISFFRRSKKYSHPPSSYTKEEIPDEILSCLAIGSSSCVLDPAEVFPFIPD